MERSVLEAVTRLHALITLQMISRWETQLRVSNISLISLQSSGRWTCPNRWAGHRALQGSSPASRSTFKSLTGAETFSLVVFSGSINPFILPARWVFCSVGAQKWNELLVSRTGVLGPGRVALHTSCRRRRTVWEPHSVLLLYTQVIILSRSKHPPNEHH